MVEPPLSASFRPRRRFEFSPLFFVQRPGRQTLRLLVGLNLLHLAFFKYFYFLLDSISIVLPVEIGALLQTGSSVLPPIILPLGICFYTFQIYMDFSGYSDMARGLAYALGYRIPANFRSPYFSLSLREFWQRWHSTLSQWLRDYLYIPLGGNRVSPFRNHLNLFLTMVLGGLWHGANVAFLIWGGLHGLYLVVERVFKLQPKPTARRSERLLRGFIVFHLVLLAWVFFRAHSVDQAISILSGSVGSVGAGIVKFPLPRLS